MVQYNIVILGGPLVTHVNVVFSVWEVTRKSRDACGTSVIHAGIGTAVFLPSDNKSRKGFSVCVGEATGRLLRRSNTEARPRS